MAVRALGRGNLLDGTVRFEGQLLKCGLVVGVTQTQAAVASLSTSPDGAVGRDDERAILTGFDLELETPTQRFRSDWPVETLTRWRVSYRLCVAEAGGEFGLEDFLLRSLHELVAAVAAPHVHLARLGHHGRLARLDAVRTRARPRVIRRHATDLQRRRR